jgi:hypothetical protein
MIANQNADHECVWSVFVVICPDPVLVKAIVLHEEMAWKQHRRFALTCWAAVDQIFGAFGRPVCDETKSASNLSFFYVCPKPVLVNDPFDIKGRRGSTQFSHLTRHRSSGQVTPRASSPAKPSACLLSFHEKNP